jgi:hypothetical protein
MLVCYVGTHLLDYRVSQNPENASGEKTKRKTCNKIHNPGNTKENMDESLRFIMTLCDTINYYCKEKRV